MTAMHGIVLTPVFLKQADRCGLVEEDLIDMASAIASDPMGGDLIAGSGGARKMRHAGRGHGKSGGYRTIHYFGGDDVPLFLLSVYGKGEKANLSPAERNQLAGLLPKIAVAYKMRSKL